jgi:signal transduction histidine kinase
MTPQWRALSRRYQTALEVHLQRGRKVGTTVTQQLGVRAVQLGLETLDLARMHKAALTGLVSSRLSSGARIRLVQQASLFFAEAITPIEKTHRAGVKSAAQLQRQNKTLTQRTAQLAVAQRQLKEGIVARKAAQEALRESGENYVQLLKESHELQQHLQQLTHKILSAQEDGRTKISHELQDEIAQTLLGINARLLTLKKGAEAHGAGLEKEIASTQHLVQQSIKTINRFARGFTRPT